RRGSTGALASTLKEFESIRDFLTSATLTTFIDIPFAILFLVVIWLIGGPIAWVPLLSIPIMLLAGLAVQPQLRRLTQQAQEDG
ncbi:MAG: type I secretion system permease/ATPase, partial [Rhodoferax sp.]|nr:type I secretion system permease/ATPase [Rhodoferax sp.]